MVNNQFKPLIEDPEKYRMGDNFRATNVVFPVNYNGEACIVKRPRGPYWLADLIERIYVSQDGRFYGTGRQPSTARERLGREADILNGLNGNYSPKLFAYDETSATLVREFLEGYDFRSLLYSNGLMRDTLDGGLDATIHIHERNLPIGDNHVKNLILGLDGIVRILDFEGKFNTSNQILSMATDLLKLIYTTWAVTRSEELTLHIAEMVSKEYPGGNVKDLVRELVSPGLSAKRLWWPTRIPRDGKLNEEIKTMLRS